MDHTVKLMVFTKSDNIKDYLSYHLFHIHEYSVCGVITCDHEHHLKHDVSEGAAQINL